MTFNQAKNKLDQMTDKDFDKYCKLLSYLHSKIKKIDKDTADAIELSSMAMLLYCKK